MTKEMNLLATKYNSRYLTKTHCYSCSNSHSKHSLQCIAVITVVAMYAATCQYHLEYDDTMINNLRFFMKEKSKCL